MKALVSCVQCGDVLENKAGLQSHFRSHHTRPVPVPRFTLEEHTNGLCDCEAMRRKAILEHDLEQFRRLQDWADAHSGFSGTRYANARRRVFAAIHK